MQRLSRNLVLPTRLRLVQLATDDILVLRVTRYGGIVGPKLAELRPKNRQKQPQKGLFLACFQHNPFVSPQNMVQTHPPPLSPPRDS